jgi:hydroxyethylthiazole kinase
MQKPISPPLTSGLAEAAFDVLARVRERRPLVHCMTNAVAQNFTANVLLAAGAIPSMTVAAEEIAEFVSRADALLINLGTLDRERREAAQIAIEVAADEQRPWVLDPVFVDRSRQRAEFAKSLIARRPSAVRLNPAEFMVMAQAAPSRDALERYALEQLGVVALTGVEDVITDGVRMVRIENGDPLMGKVTAMGCAGTALVGACLAVETDAWAATFAGLLAFAVAGERAAARSRGPGSLTVEILDALASLDRNTLLAHARVR